MTPLDRLLAALDQNGRKWRRVNGHTMAQCPAHDDRNPSLSIRESSDGTLLLKCFAGCETADVLDVLGLKMADLFATEYRYDDGRRVQRSYDATGQKRFRQSGNTAGRPTLYRLGKVRQAVANGEPVYLVEGEKDVHALEALGVTATTTPMGAGNLAKADLTPLAGAAVVAVVDLDGPGAKWAATVAELLPAVELVTAAAGKDAADHIAAGLGLDDFAPFTPPPPAGASDLHPEPVAVHHGQARFAYRLAAAYAGRLLHVFGLGWHYWDGTRWAPDDRGEATRAVLDVLRQEWAAAFNDAALARDVRAAESAAGVRGVLELAAALEPFATVAGRLDADPYLLNCSNGTLDLHTLTLRPHDPADRITKVCRAAYDPAATSPEWELFLARVLPDEAVRSYLQRFVGVALVGAVREQEFTIATGPGANGKGVFYGCVHHALGDYAHTAESDLFMTTKANANAASPAVMALRGRRFVVCSETERDHRLAAALMKNLTGGDPITARGLHRDPVTFDPAHTVLMVTNFLPKVAGNDPAVWRRMRVVPFDVTIPEAERDPELGERLKLSADAVLAWSVAGLRDYQSRAGMDAPEAVQTATAAYRSRSDAIARFIEERLLVNPHMWASVADLWTAWEVWAADDGAEPVTKRDLSDEFDKRGWPVATQRMGSRTARVRKGIGLADSDEDDQ